MNIEMVQEEVVNNAIKQMEKFKTTRFTQLDSARFRAAFVSFKTDISDKHTTLERIELTEKGKFMNIFITRNEENVSTINSSFDTFALLDVVLVKAFSSRGWKLIRTLVTREGDVLHFNVRIGKQN